MQPDSIIKHSNNYTLFFNIKSEKSEMRTFDSLQHWKRKLHSLHFFSACLLSLLLPMRTIIALVHRTYHTVKKKNADIVQRNGMKCWNLHSKHHWAQLRIDRDWSAYFFWCSNHTRIVAAASHTYSTHNTTNAQQYIPSLFHRAITSFILIYRREHTNTHAHATHRSFRSVSHKNKKNHFSFPLGDQYFGRAKNQSPICVCVLVGIRT